MPVGSTGPAQSQADPPPDIGHPVSNPEGGPGMCCPIDPAPGCCMHFGGWAGASGGACGEACDGMPWPSYPGWEKRIDDHGCEFWYTPRNAPAGCGVFPDSGTTDPPDADVDAGHDAG